MSGFRSDGGIVCFGEVLLRLSAPGAELLLQSPQLSVCVGGAEANVAVSLATLGHNASVLSALPDNALGHAARNELRRYGVDTSRIAFTTGRMGLYFLSPGAGGRAAEVIYDRAASSFAATDHAATNWSETLKEAGWLHVSGVTAALGANAAAAAIRAVTEARKLGLTVSFDCNYRAKLWQAWNGDAPAILRQILAQSDIAFGNERDIALILGGSHANAREASDAARKAFPNLKLMAATNRVQHSVNHHALAAALHTREGSWEAPAIEVTHIVDRIGAGDAFAAGLIHALRNGSDNAAAIRFALGAACIKHTIPGDFNLASAAEIEAFLAADLSVRR
ncbi:MAG: sugar kinase [Alphaproteobacteria bacterium]|nr:sugar kinase [Alphaproteobacteria bacterium]